MIVVPLAQMINPMVNGCPVCNPDLAKIYGSHRFCPTHLQEMFAKRLPPQEKSVRTAVQEKKSDEQ